MSNPSCPPPSTLPTETGPVSLESGDGSREQTQPDCPLPTAHCLTAEQLQAIATKYISERYPAQLAIFLARFPNPPADASAAHELGFTAGLLLGLDIATQVHGPGSTEPDPTEPAPIHPARSSLLQLAQ